MKKYISTSVSFNLPKDLSERLNLVMSVYKKLGHINRKNLAAAYGITQIDAGSLMRDFIEAHATKMEWDAEHGYYILTTITPAYL